MRAPSTELVSVRDPASDPVPDADADADRRRARSARRRSRLGLLLDATARTGARSARRAGPRARRAVGHTLAHLRMLAGAAALLAVVKAAPLARACLSSPAWGQHLHALTDRVLERRFWLRALAAALLAVALGLVCAWLSGARAEAHTGAYSGADAGAGAGFAGGVVEAAELVVRLVELGLYAPLVLVLVLLAGRRLLGHTSFGRVRRRFGVDGWADFWDLHRHLSAHAVRRVAVTQRPSLAAALPVAPSRREAGVVAAATGKARRAVALESLPVTECGTWFGRSAVGPWWGLPCYIAFRDTAGLIAPPQTGKTATMIHHVLDHPGAVISTSTKPEIYSMTAALRARRSTSGTVELLNPDNLGLLGSSLRWDPVRGCADYRTATSRAALLVTGRKKKSEDDTRWDEWATEVLAGLLMVADLAGRSMREVARWCYAPTNKDHGALAAQKLMAQHAESVPDEVSDSLAQILNMKAEKTRDSVFFALRGAIGFMSDPAIATLCTPPRDEPMFDVETFLAERGTLYLLGSDEGNAASAPLLAAFTGYVFTAAKALATRRPGQQRLDPPLLMSLDEAALITPVPLPQWLADAGGRGIHIIWSVQTPSQLRDTWGEQGAQTIVNATNALMVFGGLKDDVDLRQASVWLEERYELLPDPDGDGPGHAKYERVPGCPPARVRLLDSWHALFVYRNVPATVLRIWPAWQRRDVRAATADRRPALPPAIPTPRPAPPQAGVAAGTPCAGRSDDRSVGTPVESAASVPVEEPAAVPAALTAPVPAGAAPDPYRAVSPRARARRGAARGRTATPEPTLALDLDLGPNAPSTEHDIEGSDR